MIFDSLFNLIEYDTDGVYKFICRVFFETNSELCIADRLYLFAMVKKFIEEKNPNEELFIKLFENKKGLLKVLRKITGDGEFNFFTNNKEVKLSQLSETAVNLSRIYAEIFGISRIKNPENCFC